MSSGVLLVLSSFPTGHKAAEIGALLVDERLAACVNIVPGMTSIYRWRGEVHREAEALALIKTTRARYDALVARLAELHPYEVPEMIAIDVVAGAASYLDWVRDETD